MNTADLKTAYPLLTNEHNNTMYRLEQISSNCKDIFEPSTKIDDEETEINYLRELEVFLKDIHNTEIKRINNRIRLITNSNNFDGSKVKNLPHDIIYEIASYLEPEIKFTRKFSMLRQLDMGFVTLGWIDVYRFVEKVPKKLIIDLIYDCRIYPSEVKSSDKKEEWCKFIYTQIHTLFSKEKSAIRIDKLIEQHTLPIFYCNKDLIVDFIVDKWFKVILHIVAYKNYRKLLEGKLKKTDTKIKVLKNTKIVVKKNI